MVELAHILAEPPSLAAHRAKHPTGPWIALSDMSEKDELRHQLNVEQDGPCIYCESPLGKDGGHVEHIVARSTNSCLTFVYTNLAHSCSSGAHCGHFKGNSALPIKPRPGCSGYFQLSYLTGHLLADRQLGIADQQRATTSLDVLGLNLDTGLVRQRQQQAVTVCALAQTSLNDVDDYLVTAPFRFTLRRWWSRADTC